MIIQNYSYWLVVEKREEGNYHCLICVMCEPSGYPIDEYVLWYRPHYSDTQFWAVSGETYDETRVGRILQVVVYTCDCPEDKI